MRKIVFVNDENQTEYRDIPANVFDAVEHLMDTYSDIYSDINRDKIRKPNSSEIPTGSTTKNDLGVNLISKSDVDRIINCPYFRQADKLIQIMNLPSVTFKDQLPTKNDLGVDCIDREKVIIEGAWNTELAGLDNKKIVDMLKDLASVTPQEPKWISVKDRLPQRGEYGDVLVTFIPTAGTLWATVMIARYSDLMGIAKPCFHIGEVGKKSFENITPYVIAWMPLPKPYEPQKSLIEQMTKAEIKTESKNKMSLHITDKEVQKQIKQIGYKGCKNCQHQIAPLRMCEWAEQGGDGRIHLICPKWDKAETETENEKN